MITVDKAVKAFEEAGAHVEEVKIDIPRSHMELSDMWCRLIAPKQVAVFAKLYSMNARPVQPAPGRLIKESM